MAWRRRSRKVPKGGRPPEAGKRAVAIYLYGAASAIIIPLPGADPDDAESYLVNLRSGVIDAQRHSVRQLRIEPFIPGADALVVEPSEIQRVVLVDSPVDPPAQDDGDLAEIQD